MEELSFRAAIVGDRTSAEMSPVRDAIRQELADWQLREFPNLGALLKSVPAENYFPELVLVCQTWRDECSLDTVRQCLATFPVSRWICAYGPWCESEGRHGSHWPIAVRVGLSSIASRLAIEAAVVNGRVPALALTADRDERFAFECQPWPTCSPKQSRVTVSSPDAPLRSWLRDVCRRSGYEIWGEPDREPAGVIVMDLDPWTAATQARLSTLREKHPRAKILGLMGLVTRQQQRELDQRGVDALLAKLSSDVRILQTLEGLAQGE